MESLIDAMNSTVAPHLGANNQATETTEALPESTPKLESDGTPESKQELVSPRLSALIKRENALIKRERDLKMQLEETKKSTEGKMTREEFEKALMDEYEEDPYEFLSKRNMSYEKLQNRILAGDEGQKFTKLERMVTSLQAKLEEKEKKSTEESEASMASEYEEKKAIALETIANQLKDNDEFELVVQEGHFDQVFDVIQEYYEKTGKILSAQDAARLVESHLEEEYRKRLQYKKVKNWMSPSETPIKSSSPGQSSPDLFKETKTISSDMSASSDSKSDLELSDEERMKKAILAFQGKL